MLCCLCRPRGLAVTVLCLCWGSSQVFTLQCWPFSKCFFLCLHMCFVSHGSTLFSWHIEGNQIYPSTLSTAFLCRLLVVDEMVCQVATQRSGVPVQACKNSSIALFPQQRIWKTVWSWCVSTAAHWDICPSNDAWNIYGGLCGCRSGLRHCHWSERPLAKASCKRGFPERGVVQAVSQFRQQSATTGAAIRQQSASTHEQQLRQQWATTCAAIRSTHEQQSATTGPG